MQLLKVTSSRASRVREALLTRQNELKEQMQRLSSAVAEGGHSPSLLEAIDQREQELAELQQEQSDLSDHIRSNNLQSDKNP